MRNPTKKQVRLYYEKEIKHKCVLLIETLNSRLSHFS